MFPAVSTPTHGDTDGHDKSSRKDPESTLAAAHALAPPFGSLAVITSPLLSIATQQDTDGHDTPVREVGEAVRSLVFRLSDSSSETLPAACRFRDAGIVGVVAVVFSSYRGAKVTQCAGRLYFRFP
jgi:hypothetical protein